MKTRRLAHAGALFAAALLTTVLATEAAWACSCVRAPFEGSVSGADAIFTGKVTAITYPKADASGLVSSADPMNVTLAVDEVFKGAPGATVTLTTARSDTSCGYPFERGKRYLVYARAHDGGLRTGLCSRTRPLGPRAKDDLRCLRRVRADPASLRDGCASKEEHALRERQVKNIERRHPGLPAALEAAWRACLHHGPSTDRANPRATIAVRVDADGRVTILRFQVATSLPPDHPMVACVSEGLERWKPEGAVVPSVHGLRLPLP